ncbi:MAG: hypothetical protein ACXAC5_00900 [Promethearchaeota archaeon]|jgi:hypothetical protein
MIDVSIAIPSIHPERWEDVVGSLSQDSCNYEIWFVGPAPFDKKLPDYVHCIQDYGAPTRCAQIAASHSSGELFTWAADDGRFLPGALTKLVEYFAEHCKSNDEMIGRYTEAAGFNTNTPHHDNALWTAGYHALHINEGIDPDDKIAPVGLLDLQYFRSIGGFDCAYEHINMSCIDLSIRIQRAGGVLHFSPQMLLKFDHTPKCPEYAAVRDAFQLNDLPLFKQHYSNRERPLKIDFDNWKQSPDKWRRFL